MINKLKKILITTVDVKEDIQLSEDTVILRDLGVDSLEMVELVCAVEDEFDIEIADKKIKSLVTIGDLIKHIESQR